MRTSGRKRQREEEQDNTYTAHIHIKVITAETSQLLGFFTF